MLHGSVTFKAAATATAASAAFPPFLRMSANKSVTCPQTGLLKSDLAIIEHRPVSCYMLETCSQLVHKETLQVVVGRELNLMRDH